MTISLRYDQPLTYTISGVHALLSDEQILNIVKDETKEKGYLLLDTGKVEQRLSETNFFKNIRVSKGKYRHIDIFVEEKKIVMKQNRSDGIFLFDDGGGFFQTDTPTSVPIVDNAIKTDDIKIIAEALGAQTSLLLHQISEITYGFVGEARTELKLVTIQGDIIYVKLKDLKKKLPNFLEIDTIMNQKNILRCEYHFEYNNGSVVVNEMK